MKKLGQCLFASLMILTCIANATVRTVSNAGGAQFFSLDAAIAGAVAGDTIYLKNTNIPYQIADCDPGWSKPLVVMGIGFNPDIVNPKKVQMSNYEACNSGISNGNFALGSGGNGTKFYGVEFIQTIVTTAAITNYTFEDCSFSNLVNFGYFSAGGVLFKNCAFKANNTDNLLLTTNQASPSIAFTECIFNGSINGNNNNVSSLIFDHCLFLSTTVSLLSNLQTTTIQNSIFMNNAAVANNTANCTFNNNMAQLGATLPPAGNTGTANLVNTDPLFVNYTLGNFYSTSHNYRLQAGSPGIGAGIGGTDIGLHSSNSTFNEAGEPTMTPIIRNMTIEGVNVQQNGKCKCKSAQYQSAIIVYFY